MWLMIWMQLSVAISVPTGAPAPSWLVILTPFAGRTVPGRGFEIYHQLKLGRLLDWKVFGLSAAEDLDNQTRQLAIDKLTRGPYPIKPPSSAISGHS